jgi:hypothetical protein
MNQASYILTYRRGDGPERERNLCAVLAWLARYEQLDVIVVEQDNAPRLPPTLPHPRVRAVFAYNPGPFNKSWGFNIGARLSERPWLGFADADLLLGDALAETLGHLTSGLQSIKPYRRLIDLDPAESERAAADPAWLPPPDPARAPDRDASGERLAWAGGAFFVTRYAWQRLGCWDERFRGWGGEDDAMSWRMEFARTSGIELEHRPALHLYHPRPRSATLGQPHYRDNVAVLAEHRSYDQRRLVRFAEVQAQVAGRVDKYRPDR